MKTLNCHPTISLVLEKIKEKGITRRAFACELIDFLPDGAQYLQGSGEEKTCTSAHQKAVYRMLQGKHVPRKPVLTAMVNWANQQ